LDFNHVGLEKVVAIAMTIQIMLGKSQALADVSLWQRGDRPPRTTAKALGFEPFRKHGVFSGRNPLVEAALRESWLGTSTVIAALPTPL
jgi:hypothetical protein